MLTKDTVLEERLLRTAIARTGHNFTLKAGEDLADALMTFAVDREARSTKLHDDYEQAMCEAGKAVLVCRAVVIAKAKGQNIPQERGELQRFMEQRVPEWGALLAKHGRDVEWASRMMQWSFDLPAARQRRELQVKRVAEAREERKVLIQNNPKVANVRHLNPPAVQKQHVEKAVSRSQVSDAYCQIGARIRRIRSEDLALVLQALHACRDVLDELL